MGISITGGVKVPQGKFKVYVAPPVGPELWAWGRNNIGQLGDETTTYRSSPVQIGALKDWSSSGSGGSDTHLIKTDGTLWGMGAALLVGNGTGISRSSPIQIGSLTNWSSIDSGSATTLAVKTDGTLWSWGDANYSGRLGLGDAISRSSPVQIGSLTDWTSVSAGVNFNLAVKTNGTLWAWGAASAGRLGNNTTTPNRSSPVQIGALSDWANVSAAVSHSLAVKTDGTLWSWGRGTTGRTGHNDTVYRSSPVQIGALTDWSSVSAGYDHSMALKTNGTLWGWGANTVAAKAPVGDNTVIDRSSPVQIGALTDWASISSGRRHNVALKTDGTIWAWGEGTEGQLGDGPVFTYRKSPRQIGSETTWTNITAGLRHSIALKTV